MKNRVPLVASLFLCAVAAWLCVNAWGQSNRDETSRLLSTRQFISPAGIHTSSNDRVYGVSFGASMDDVWILVGNNDREPGVGRLTGVNWKENREFAIYPLEGTVGLQGVRLDRANGRVLVSGTLDAERVDGAPKVGILSFGREGNKILHNGLGRYLAGSPAAAIRRNKSGRRPLIVPLTANSEVGILDADTGDLIWRVRGGVAPFAAVVSADGSTAWVSNWAGRFPLPGESALTAGSGPGLFDDLPVPDKVLVDNRGVVASGSVTQIDLESGHVSASVETGLHPNGLAWSETRQRLYVANNNSDSISVIDTKQARVVSTFRIEPFGSKAFGVAPSALAMSPGGDTLYVACSGINAIAVMDPMSGKVRGYIPTAWYPNSLDISSDGRWLAVGTLHGFGQARNKPYPASHLMRGAVSVVPVPSSEQLESFSTAVAENNRIPLRSIDPPNAAPNAPAVPIPARAGQPSTIQHVVYIIKENKTYDSYFGDLPRGNGDRSLLLYDDRFIPNHRRLARDFVLLDNIYSNGRQSGDGHQWLTQAMATGYVWWPGYTGRSYPFNGNDPIALSSKGALWDLMAQAGRSVRVFGEYLPDRPIYQQLMRRQLLQEWKRGGNFRNRFEVHARYESLNRHVVHDYPVWDLRIPDVVRASIFISHLRQWEAEGKMPDLSIVQLPGDHGRGSKAGVSTLRAFVADNDLALGHMVEALTRSKFWPRMAIFVIEDDTGGLPDHVDPWRTAALVISPWVRREFTDSTFYSQVSVVKTIERIFGLPALTMFDLIANDMRNCFQSAADTRPWSSVVPSQDLFEETPELRALSGPLRQAALDTAAMDFRFPDATALDRYAQIEWHLARGWQTTFPASGRGVFMVEEPQADRKNETDVK